MTTALLSRNKQKAQLEDIQRGVLEAYSRGLLSERQAMGQLGLKNYDQLISMLERVGLKAWESGQEVREIGNMTDGYIHYWLNSNPKE